MEVEKWIGKSTRNKIGLNILPWWTLASWGKGEEVVDAYVTLKNLSER